ncbi:MULTISPECIES: NAD(P)H-quinone oxidoreductase [Kosakonia]|uniref:NAD(P)H-quinone oxidoreductase n=1 Tax=Kosakonia TaxID=1330547 RepID=UPI0008BF3C4B|nr:MULTISPECIES: NAD(P)H-quinone oxidoreductase [Kosakonia]MDD7995601.1 NAD(P)H-quinone oxidoreductase [Kosakonia radicincitans]NCF06751.1 NAD(P)H-quinone oxidoreductase [Kosakonia sp. MH5]PTA91903.1 NAD(P)H-quinone oxidoreductase [Kosakonia sp. H7A]SES85745.1 putative NAD(P)H quinone oxidoreductase, PIG3 family [Kosakonia radicincitans]VVT51153.1 Quinone oxidoreductase (EC [Kosakonia radicincitans]
MIPEMMNAVIACRPGGPEVLERVQRPVPLPGAGEVLIRVASAGVNRPDILQRNGMPLPPGVTDVLGLEVSGTVVALGAGVEFPAVGSPVMALLNGGGYADYCVARAELCLSVPETLPLAQAAGVPEAAFTVWHNLFELGRLQPGETVLIHGAASGVGTFAIQCAQACGARVIATAGGSEKIAALRQLGVWRAINRHSEDFVAVVLAATEGRGVDVVLDNVGGDYVARNLSVLAPGGRHVSLSFMQGAKIELDLQLVMRKGLSLTSSTLRPKSVAEKMRLAQCISKHLLPLIAAGKVAPTLYQTLPLAQAADAHRILEANANIGKVLLQVAS